VLYPYSSRALALGLDWRRRAIAVGPLTVSPFVGWEINLDASGETFAPEAFPDGPRWGLEVGVPWTSPHGVSIRARARELEAHRHERRLELTGWMPLASRHRLWLQISHGPGHCRHLFAEWMATLTFDMRGLLAPDS
jgi:hypothetical protein